MRSTRLIQLDTATGAVVLDETWPSPVSERGAQVHDAASDTHLVRGSDGWAKLFLNRGGGGGETLSGIVSDLCARAGLGPSDIDVVDLGAIVPGYVIGRQTTVRGAIEPLAQAYFFDAAESDDTLRFRTRGRQPAATIDADHLLPLDERTFDRWRERRTQEVELPERVSVVYMDAHADYSQGTQSAKRTSLPRPTMQSRNQSRMELALALDATTAKQIAAKTLYSAWIERSAYEAELPADWLRLDPTDVADVVFATGSRFRTRITRLDVGADFSLAVTGVSEAAATYVSNVAADGGSGRQVQVVGRQAATRLILPDLPLLRDTDDTGGSGSRLYYMMAGFGGPGWPGASLYRSPDGTDWARVGRSLSEAAWGATANALGTPTSPFASDETNSLTVFMTSGGDRLESVTQNAMLGGANAALVLKADGAPEVIQFRDVTLNPDGSYTLSGLLRGRRGTDVFVDGHATGEVFVLLDPDDVETLAIALGDLGLPRTWRAVGFGALFEEAETVTHSHAGRDLKPYAPVSVTATRSGTPDDITLSWIRRTRIGGDLRDGTGTVPLAEVSEAYEVDILDGPGARSGHDGIGLLDVSAGGIVSVPSAQALGLVRLVLTGAPGAAVTVAFPAVKRLVLGAQRGGRRGRHHAGRGAAETTVEPGDQRLLYLSGGGVQPAAREIYDFGFVSMATPGPGDVIGKVVMPRDVLLPAGLQRRGRACRCAARRRVVGGCHGRRALHRHDRCLHRRRGQFHDRVAGSGADRRGIGRAVCRLKRLVPGRGVGRGHGRHLARRGDLMPLLFTALFLSGDEIDVNVQQFPGAWIDANEAGSLAQWRGQPSGTVTDGDPVGVAENQRETLE